MRPDPLEDSIGQHHNPIRILSDRGIRQAIEQRFIQIIPSIDLADTTRIQPATLDVCIHDIEDAMALGRLPHKLIDGLVLTNESSSCVELTERIECTARSDAGYPFLGCVYESRSSVLRLGGFVPRAGSIIQTASHTVIEMGNLGPNNLFFDHGERIAQVFFTVDPFADLYGIGLDLDKPLPYSDLGDRIRSLSMGVEVCTEEQVRSLAKEGYMDIAAANGQQMHMQDSCILLHAGSQAYRMKELGNINFSSRRHLTEEDLFEPIDISRGYEIQPFEQIVIETAEIFDISPHVGVRIWDNLFIHHPDGSIIDYMVPDINGQGPPHHYLYRTSNGWVDPGYKGIMTRFPKNSHRIIHPGDIIGYGQVFFFPEGVEQPYGNSNLGSQYQQQKGFQIKER
jgi:hypothetical protein